MRIDLPKQVLAAAVALIVASGAVLAQPPEWAGQGKGKGKGKDRGEGKAQSQHFRSEHRSHVRDYYDSEFRGGHCPRAAQEEQRLHAAGTGEEMAHGAAPAGLGGVLRGPATAGDPHRHPAGRLPVRSRRVRHPDDRDRHAHGGRRDQRPRALTLRPASPPAADRRRGAAAAADDRPSSTAA